MQSFLDVLLNKRRELFVTFLLLGSWFKLEELLDPLWWTIGTVWTLY